MASKSATPTLTAPAGSMHLPQGADLVFFEKGTDIYEKLRLNGDIEIKMEDGSTRKGNVRATQVAPLIDLISSYGPRHVSTYGQAYSANHLVQMLTEVSGSEVLDVTKLYTAVTVLIPMEPMPTPASPV